MIFLLLFSYVILCDFFPLHDFPADLCEPASHIRESQDDADNKNDDPRSTVKSLIESTTKSYGFQRRQLPSITELILAVWVFTLVCEEIRQVSHSSIHLHASK